MGNEIKSASFRLGEDDIKRFREIAEQQGLNQAEMFQGLINSFEMAKAKGVITDRAKEIETFQDTVNNLIGMFINSLAINQTSEERIRETLSVELSTKDNTIKDLQEFKTEKTKAIKQHEDDITRLILEGKGKSEEITRLNEDMKQKNLVIETQQKQINTLSEITTEYKVYKDVNDQLEVDKENLNNCIKELTLINKDLENKMENLESMKEFFKNELSNAALRIKEIEVEHKDEIKSLEANNKIQVDTLNSECKKEYKSIEDGYKKQIKALESEHKKEIKEIEAFNRESINSLKEELKNQFDIDLKNKIEVEKIKYEAKLDKMQSLELRIKELEAELNKKS